MDTHSGRTILITGGAGFIGGHAADRFAQEGWRVIILDNLSRLGAPQNLAWLSGRHPGLVHEALDVADGAGVAEAFARHRPDGVLHLAGQVAVTTSVAHPRQDFEANALGTLNVLEAVRAQCPEAPLVYASTNKVYGQLQHVKVVDGKSRYAYAEFPFGIPESQPLSFHSPYGCSKGAADQYVVDYARIYGLRSIALRQSCIYGPRQFGVEDQGWIAWFTIASILQRPITVYGDGKQVRDILHVEDLVDLYVACIERPDQLSGRAWNVGGGPDQALSLLDLIDWLRAHVAPDLVAGSAAWRPGDQRVFISDIRAVASQTDWYPKRSIEAGLQELAAWTRDNQALLQSLLVDRTAS